MKVQLSIGARGVPSDDALYFAKVSAQGDGAVLGQTQPRTGNGTFSDLILLQDDAVEVTVGIYNAADETLVGQQSFPVQTILNSYTHATAKPAQESTTNDSLIIALHATEQTNGQLRVILQGHDLPNTDFGLFGKQKTDPIYEIYNHLGTKLARSNKVEDNLDPVWNEQRFDLEELCGTSLTAPLRLTVYDRDKGDSVEYLGTVTWSVQQMVQEPSTKVPLLRGGERMGDATLSVQQAELLPVTKVPRSAATALDAALSALAGLEQLKEQAGAQKEAADAAKLEADEARQQATSKQEAADTVAQAQLKLQTKFSQLAQEATKVAETAKTREYAGMLHFVLAAQDLADVDFGIRNKSDPIYEIFVLDGNTRLIRSNKVDNNLNPVWDPQTLDLAQVQSLDTPLKVVVSDRDGKDKQQMLGSIETSIQKLVDSKKEGNSFIMPLVEQPRPDRDSGRLVVQEATLIDFENLKEKAQTLRVECEAAQAELDQATKSFGDAQKEAEEASQIAAQAAESAAKAMEQAKAAQMAVETAEASIE